MIRISLHGCSGATKLREMPFNVHPCSSLPMLLPPMEATWKLQKLVLVAVTIVVVPAMLPLWQCINIPKDCIASLKCLVCMTINVEQCGPLLEWCWWWKRINCKVNLHMTRQCGEVTVFWQGNDGMRIMGNHLMMGQTSQFASLRNWRLSMSRKTLVVLILLIKSMFDARTSSNNNYNKPLNGNTTWSKLDKNGPNNTPSHSKWPPPQKHAYHNYTNRVNTAPLQHQPLSQAP